MSLANHTPSEVQVGDPLDLTPAIWAHLPTELVRLILIFAATISPSHAYNICLVSLSARYCVIHLIFHSLSLSSLRSLAQFFAIIWPKRSYFPRVPPPPQMPSVFPIRSLALALPSKLPSTEGALSSIASNFHNVQSLAITPSTLSAHGYWLRQNPSITPQYIMLFHHGEPSFVNFDMSVFAECTHLWTSTISGYSVTSESTMINLPPKLTHLAVETLLNLPLISMAPIAYRLAYILASMPTLKSLVLSINTSSLNQSVLTDTTLTHWLHALSLCIADNRFHILPYTRPARLQWSEITALTSPFISATPSPLVWERANEWDAISNMADPELRKTRMEEIMRIVQLEWATRPREAWDLDLVRREGLKTADSDEELLGRSGYIPTVYPREYIPSYD